MPAVTCNEFGKGKAYYVATDAQKEFFEDFYKSIDCIFDDDNMDSITEIISLALSPIYRGNI